MVVLGGLPTKTGVCVDVGSQQMQACQWEEEPAITNMGQELFPMLSSLHACMASFLPIIMHFLGCTDDRFPTQWRKITINFSLISLLESFLKGLIIISLIQFSKFDIGEAETFCKNEYGKDCLRQILESCLLSQHCLSCQTHYLIAFSCQLCEWLPHLRFFCWTPLPCIFSCLVDISSWRCSRMSKLSGSDSVY